MKKESIILRVSNDDDLSSLLSLYRDLAPNDLPLGEDQARKIYQQILADDAFMILVLEVDQLIVSTCALSIIPNLTRGGMSYAVIKKEVPNVAH